MSTYICSDIHGQGKLFYQMLSGINFSDSDELYIVGDLIDRGPDTVELLQYVVQRQKNIHLLMGNHELMMVMHYHPFEYQNKFYDSDPWFNPANGGRTTAQLLEKLPESEQKAILDYLVGLPLQIELTVGDKTILLSHSSFISDKQTVMSPDVEYDIIKGIVWDSPWRFWEYCPKDYYRKDGRWHVIGHVPVQAIREYGKNEAYVDEENHIVNIDLGCAILGREEFKEEWSTCGLCCMNLDKFVVGEDAFRYWYWK